MIVSTLLMETEHLLHTDQCTCDFQDTMIAVSFFFQICRHMIHWDQCRTYPVLIPLLTMEMISKLMVNKKIAITFMVILIKKYFRKY